MNNLLFDFNVDKPAQTVTITREFDAELPLVWDAFTKQEILDQWWAPAPWASETKSMNFEIGGSRFYAMVGPDGKKNWALQTYNSITPKTNFKFLNAFADENANPSLPGSDWDLTFTEKDGITTVKVAIYNESAERMEQQLSMGFKEGFSMTLESLGTLLKKLSAK